MEKEILNKSSFSRSSRSALLGSIPFIAAVYGFTQPAIFITTKRFGYSTKFLLPASIDDKEMTQLCMSISEKSLAKDWAMEDDQRWNSLLND